MEPTRQVSHFAEPVCSGACSDLLVWHSVFVPISLSKKKEELDPRAVFRNVSWIEIVN